MAYDRELDEESNFFEEDPAYNDTYFGERLDSSDDSAVDLDETEDMAAEEATPEETPATAEETFGESITPEAMPDEMAADDMEVDESDEMDRTT